jgi:hypothetical protein
MHGIARPRFWSATAIQPWPTNHDRRDVQHAAGAALLRGCLNLRKNNAYRPLSLSTCMRKG